MKPNRSAEPPSPRWPRIVLLALLCLLAATEPSVVQASLGSEIAQPEDRPSGSSRYLSGTEGRLAAYPARAPLFSSGRESEPPSRSPGLVFVMSALVPGTGQLYNGNNRGFLYLGLEVASWFARIAYIDASNAKEDEFRAYGSRHWSYEKFGSNRGDGCGWTVEADTLIRQNIEDNPNRFYDEIGRNDDYRCGWDDFDATQPETKSPHWQTYSDMLSKENSLRDRARLAVGVMVVNRIVSAVDAFRTARGRTNESRPLRLESHVDGSLESPRLRLQLIKEFP